MAAATVQLFYGDCFDHLPQIPDHSIQLILCDLPFGVTAPQWDSVLPMSLLWEHYKRILKPEGTVAIFAAQPFTTKLISSNEKDFRYCWYWLKNQGTNFFHAKRMPIRKVEEICIFNRGNYYPQHSTGHVPTNSAKGCSNGKTYHGENRRDYEGGATTRFPTNVLEFKCVDNYSRIHSAEKPVELLEYLIKTYSQPGELVLDHCAGSFSTGVACLNTDRAFIGVEKDEKYFEMGQQRLEDHQRLRDL